MRWKINTQAIRYLHAFTHTHARARAISKQVERCGELKKVTKGKAGSVKAQATEVTNLANDAARSSERQQRLFAQASEVGEEAKASVDKALAAFR